MRTKMNTLSAGDPVRLIATGKTGRVLMVPAPEFKPDAEPTHYVTLDDGGLVCVFPSELTKVSEA